MNARGHNERSFRLDTLAADARDGLAKVGKGEEFTIEGWLAYGRALNEGRALFPGDREFGEWVRLSNLDERNGQEIHPGDRQAAMWAAANADQFEDARQRGNPRTIRGIHAKWKEIEAELEAEQRRQEADANSTAEAGSKPDQESTTATMNTAAIGARSNDGQKTEPAQQAENKSEIADEGDGSSLPVETDQENTPPTEPIDPDEAKARRDLAKLTHAALIDDVIGLRAALDDERAKRRKLEAENKDLKARLRDATDSDQGEVIRRLQASVTQAENEKWRQTEATASAMKQVYALKKRVAELEAMGIAL